MNKTLLIIIFFISIIILNLKVEKFNAGQLMTDVLSKTSVLEQKFDDLFEHDGDTLKIKPKNVVVTNDIIADYVVANKHLRIQGGDQLNNDDIQRGKVMRNNAGYAIDGGGSTHLLWEGGWHGLNDSGYADAWANDNWDMVYINKGWKVTFAEHGNGDGLKKWVHNKTKWNPIKYDLNWDHDYDDDSMAYGGDHKPDRNQATSYKAEWKGY